MKEGVSRSRRDLLELGLRGAAVASLAGILPSQGRAGDSAPLDRAAVCIYLVGGNDSNNMLVPLDSAAYASYAAGRGELALQQDILLPVNSPRRNTSFGFHPFLVEARDLYSRGVLAVLANTGSLAMPLTRAQAQSGTGLPDGLFRHENASYVDYLPNAVMMEPWARQIQQQDPSDASPQAFSIGGVSLMSPERLVISGPSANNPAIMDAIKKAQLQTDFPKSSIGSQLYRIARLLKAGPGLGLKHPIFSATMSGFDTHMDQLAQQEGLYNELSQAMSAFYAATEELGIAGQVVTYTQTEFNRTLRPNRTHGTGHGWGGHELIMGGSVRGGDVYGTFPSLELGGADDAGTDGIWIPTTANQQYEAAIAAWYGVGQGDLAGALPGLQNFPSANLGFLGS